MTAPRIKVGARILALVTCTSIGLAACGSSTPDTAIVADSTADRELGAAIVAELDEYNQPFDVTTLPPAQQAELAPIVNSLPRAGGGVKTLSISGGVVEAQTDFAADAEGVETGRLICGAIYRRLPARDPGGHRVLGAGGTVLADCKPKDASFP